jgi:hypothetical protein
MLLDVLWWMLPMLNEGSIVVQGPNPPPPPAQVERAPKMKANPTWICPDGTSNPPNLC